jgi:hypothetical protein
MSPLHQKIAAAAAVTAAASVWIARFAFDGGDDLGAFAGVPAAEGAIDGSIDSGDDWIARTEAENGGEGTKDADAALASLGAVLGFLEARERPSDAAGHAARALDLSARDSSPRSSIETDADVFLAASPVRALAIGSRRASALLGRTLVHAGDSLAGGSIRVVSIDRDGVVLDTPRGRLLATPLFVAEQADDDEGRSATPDQRQSD